MLTSDQGRRCARRLRAGVYWGMFQMDRPQGWKNGGLGHLGISIVIILVVFFCCLILRGSELLERFG